MTIGVRKGQAPPMLTREAFSERFRAPFLDPKFNVEAEAIARLEEIAWQTYTQGRKWPITRKAGEGFADPAFELSVEWLATRQRLEEAQTSWSNPASPTRVLLIGGAARNDGTCPGEMSKTYRLLNLIRDTFNDTGVQTDMLDLSFADLGIRAPHSPLPRLRFNRDAAVPRAVLVLSQLWSKPD